MAANLVGSATFLTAPEFISGKNMKKLNKGFIAVLVAGSIVTPAFAEQKQALESPTFEAADYASLFDSETARVEVASLSDEEMKNTEGAWFRYAIGGVVGGVASGLTYGHC